EHGHTLAAATDAHLRIPAVHEHVAKILVGQIAGPPRLEVLAQATDQARDRILRQRAAPQQWRQRALDPAGVPAGEGHAENRFVPRGVWGANSEGPSPGALRRVPLGGGGRALAASRPPRAPGWSPPPAPAAQGGRPGAPRRPAPFPGPGGRHRAPPPPPPRWW